MKKILVFASFLLTADIAFASVIYYPPPYLYPYMARPYTQPYNPFYHNPYYQRSVAYPTDTNSCPLQSSYYDAYGNWVAPTRVCPTLNPQVHIHIGSY